MFKYYLPIYALVFLSVFFLQVSPAKPNFSPLIPHAHYKPLSISVDGAIFKYRKK
jgi:hypothetical protein